MTTTLLGVGIASLVGGVGHVILAQGMTLVRAAASGSPLARTLSNPWVILGVALQGGLLLLAEPVTALRWTGIGFTVFGVFLVGRT
jgi:drug/metabolite transporter (DMT)-like permease